MANFVRTIIGVPIVFAWTTVAAGQVIFTDVTDAARVSYAQHSGGEPESEFMSGGAAAGDYDGDGWIDLFVTRLDGPDVLYRNLGDGTFDDVTDAAGLDANRPTNGAVWTDIDNDGDQDLYVTVLSDTRCYLYVNDGNGHFCEQALPRGAAIDTAYPHTMYSVAAGDFDRDGWVDLHTSEWRVVPNGRSHSRLLRNRGDNQPGHFVDVTELAGVGLGSETTPHVNAFTSSFADFDNDGWLDLAVVADFGTSRIFWNNHDGTFIDGTETAAVGSDEHGMGSAIADYDADGDLDWFVTAIWSPKDGCVSATDCIVGATGNRLYRNEGERRFLDATDEKGVRDGGWGWGTAFFDYDNDGDLDLIMTNGQSFSEDRTGFYSRDQVRLWRNDGDDRFTEVAHETRLGDTRPGKGLLVFDYDRDGDLDVFVTHDSDTPALFRNDGGNQRHWLRIRVIGIESARDSWGARVYVRDTEGSYAQMREISGGSNFLGQSEATAHFGLGGVDQPVYQVRVVWPATGVERILHNVAINQEIAVQEIGEPGGITPAPIASPGTLTESVCRTPPGLSETGCSLLTTPAQSAGMKGTLIFAIACLLIERRRRRKRLSAVPGLRA